MIINIVPKMEQWVQLGMLSQAAPCMSALLTTLFHQVHLKFPRIDGILNRRNGNRAVDRGTRLFCCYFCAFSSYFPSRLYAIMNEVLHTMMRCTKFSCIACRKTSRVCAQ